MVTGSDPTRLPIAAMLARIRTSALTTGACEMAAAFAAPATVTALPATPRLASGHICWARHGYKPEAQA